jgi:hypothetical protein
MDVRPSAPSEEIRVTNSEIFPEATTLAITENAALRNALKSAGRVASDSEIGRDGSK